jgi:integrase
MGRAGVVLGTEMSRLARTGRDWRQLLELCSLSGVLLAGFQAGARRAAAPTAGGLSGGRRRGDGHQRTRDHLGSPAEARPAQPLGAAARHRARVRPLPPDDRPGDRSPTAWRVPARRRRPTPYLWSPRDISRLLEAARALRPPLRAASHEALLGLLAASGMRIGEAIGLQCDVDLGAGVITIREATFDRSPLVPLHPTVTGALSRYVAGRDRLCSRPRSKAFFISSAGSALGRSGVSKTFRKITIAIGVPPRRCTRGRMI